eukprot:18955-Heterococcus_DN1.PRE.3
MAACSAASALNEMTEGIAETSARFHAACRTGSIDTVTMLLNEGADINSTDTNGLKPLHTATYYSKTELVRMLLQKDASVSAVDVNLYTALHWVKDAETATLLLQFGADINACDIGASVTAVNELQQSPLHKVPDDETAAVLLEFGADINARDENDSTPLLYAAGASLAANSRQQSALHLVRDAETATFLLKAGVDINACDDGGSTALHSVVAGFHGREKMALTLVLLRAGADLTIRDLGGYDAHDIATIAGLSESMLQLFLPQVAISIVAASSLHVPSTTQRQAPSTVPDRKTSASATVNIVATNSMIDLWLSNWLHEIGFARHDAKDYAAAMTKLKRCSQSGLAALNETKAIELATAAGISYFEIDMYIVGWQQLKASSSTCNQQLLLSSTVQMASSSAYTTAAVTAAAVAATAAPTAVTNTAIAAASVTAAASQCCPICMEDQPADNMLIMPCDYHGHSYCVECLLQHCSTQLLDNGHVPRCPGQQQCQYELSHVDLGSIWQSERYAEMKLIVLTAALDDHCPAATASPADVDRQQRVYNTMMLRRGLQDVKAVSCGKPSCNNRLNWLEQGYAQWVRDLHGAEHQLQRSQAEQQAAQELRARHDAEQATNAFLVTDCRHCPHCNSKVERMEGCDSMVCGRDYHCGNAQDGCGNRSDWATARRCIADTATTA